MRNPIRWDGWENSNYAGEEEQLSIGNLADSDPISAGWLWFGSLLPTRVWCRDRLEIDSWNVFFLCMLISYLIIKIQSSSIVQNCAGTLWVSLVLPWLHGLSDIWSKLFPQRSSGLHIL